MSRLATSRFVVPCLLVLSLLLCANSPKADAGDEDLVKKFAVHKSAWAGHGVGSLVHRKTRQTTPMGEVVTEEKKTLARITDKYFELNVESKTMVGWSKSVERVPKVVHVDVAKAKIEDAGEETLTIEGKAYPCKKKKTKDASAFVPGGMKPPAARPGKSGGKLTGEGTIWLHEKLGMLKMQMATEAMGQKMTVTMNVKRLKVSKKVGAQTLTCREIEISNSLFPSKIVQLSSEQVPGGTVRSSMSFSQGGMTMSTVEELSAYVKKPLVPVTAK